MKLEQLIELGFDRSEYTEDGLHVACSQCAALCINGTPCHEGGCPNQTSKCKECDAIIPRGYYRCEDCANPEEDSVN